MKPKNGWKEWSDSVDLQEIERAAAMGEPIPKGLSDLDWFYWRCMADLYRRYNARTIDRDTARAEKREILKRYNTLSETLQRHSEMFKEWQTNIMLAGSLRSQMVMEPDRDKSFLLALKTISAMTGEDTTEKIICQKFGLDNQKEI